MSESSSHGDTIRVGVGAPLTGSGASLGLELAQAVQLAIDERNLAGGVRGLPLEAVVEDDQGQAEPGKAIAAGFARDPQMLAVVGHYNSDVTLAAAPIYEAAGLPLISPIVSNPKLTESGWTRVFRLTNRDDITARALVAHLVQDLRKQRAAVIETTTTYGSSMSQQFVTAFGEAGGAVLSHQRIEEGTQSFSKIVEAIPSSCDLVFYGGTFEGAPLVRAMRSKGLDQLLATGDGCWDVGNFLRPAGEAASQGEGVLVLSACPELGAVRGAAEFATRYQRRFGPVLNYAVNAYDAANTVFDAMDAALGKAAALPDRAAVWAALRSLKRQGVAYPTPIEWDSRGDNLAALTALHVVENGCFRQVTMTPVRPRPV